MNEMAALQPIPQPYPPQQKAAENMITTFQEGHTMYTLFRAPLQSGKTGTYQYLIRMMLANGMIDQAYIVCGSNETQLLSQVNRDVIDWHGAHALNRRVHVIFRQYFKSVTMITRRVLIVNDESHMDCEKDQQLHRFLHRHQLTMAGTTPFMQNNKIFMVSVSATPFAEEAVMIHGDSLPKAMVRLEVDPNQYYGPMDYYRDGLLRETYSVLTEEGASRFMSEVRGFFEKKKYVIVRIRENAIHKRQMKRQMKCQNLSREVLVNGQLALTEPEGVLQLLKQIVANTPDARILRFTSQYNNKDQQIVVSRVDANAHFEKYHRRIPSLDEAPHVPTIVLLDGRLRCGKRVHKEHIGMAWDTACQSQTDVILQGLLGRMCGYRGNGYEQVPLSKENRPVIYTNHALFQKERNATIELSDLERFEAIQANWAGIGVDEDGKPLIVPRFVNHLRRVNLEKNMYRAQGGTEVHQCAPVRFQLGAHAIERLTENLTDGELRRLCWEGFVPRLVELIDTNEKMTLLQKAEIRDWVEGHDAKSCHVRRYTANTHNGYYQMAQAYHNQTGVEKDRISDGHFLTFCTVFQGFPGKDGLQDPAGTVYVSIYTEATGLFHVISLPSRVAPHDGNTHFIRGLVPTEEEEKLPLSSVVVAAAKYGFTPEIEWSPAEFETQMDYFIQVSQTGIGYFGQKFTSVGNKNGFHLSRDAYGKDLSVLRMIIQRLEATHGVRIHYIRPRGAETMTHILLRSIEWS